MRYRFFTCDVFTDSRFGGNPLAVLPEATGLSDEQMLQVAREFNYSETAFVLPAEMGHDRRVRIFTPSREVPFAGHPNIGTAFVLASNGLLAAGDPPRTVVFEEEAGLVAVTIESRGDAGLWCELTAPEAFTRGREVPVELVAGALGLVDRDIRTVVHPPLVASTGLPFVLVELTDLAALARARPDIAGLDRMLDAGSTVADVHAYVRVGERRGQADGETAGGDPAQRVDIRARMFAPFDGVYEDPATGSANCALAGLLAQLDAAADGVFTWRISQGVEMGRPSLLQARATKTAGEVTRVQIGGGSVLVSEGFISV
jgi:trans-2,3-dihydro-3-hydroxyanthranilate isomerase